jgi:hypothetical protein
MRQLFDFYARTFRTAQTGARVFFGVDGAGVVRLAGDSTRRALITAPSLL